MPYVRFVNLDNGTVMPYVQDDGVIYYRDHPDRPNGTRVSQSIDQMIRMNVKTKRWRIELWKNTERR